MCTVWVFRTIFLSKIHDTEFVGHLSGHCRSICRIFLLWREFDGDFHFSALIMADIADPICRTGKSAATSRWSSAVRSRTSSSTNLEALLPRKPGTDEGERAKRISLDPSQCLELVREPSFSNYSSELLLCSSTNIYISICWIFRVCCFFHQFMTRYPDLPPHGLIDWLLDCLIHSFLHRLLACLLACLIDWLIHQEAGQIKIVPLCFGANFG